MTTTKQCSTCKQIKSHTEFYKRTGSKDGLRSQCKICHNSNFESNKEEIYKKRAERYNLEKEEINRKRRIKYLSEIEIMREKDRLRALIPQWQAYIKQYQKEYRTREISKIIDKNKRLRRRAITKQGDVTTKQLLELQDNAKVCYWCNESVRNRKTHIDHVIPLARGGKHTISNLVISYPTCNLQKGSKDPLEFANSLGRLI